MKKSTQREKRSDMTKTAMFTSLIVACSVLCIPIPGLSVVLSVHTVAVNLTALMLEPVFAFTAILLYLVMGLLGLPVFSMFTAGPGKLFGPTGGFYFGFLVSVLVMSLSKGKKASFKRYFAVTAFVGLPIQHIFAMLFMCFYNDFNVVASFLSVSLPFIATDILKCALSSFTAVKLKRIFQKHT